MRTENDMIRLCTCKEEMTMTATFNWGIIGPGKIANKFAEGLKACPGARVLAVASRSMDRADAFAEAHGIVRRYDRYEDLVADQDVDAIYIATTHPQHYENILLCLHGGKPVVCEKPLTMNAWQAEQVISLAREKKVFLMEALWSRFLPIYRQVAAWIDEGRIGDLQMLRAEFGFAAPWSDSDRHVDINNGGGALMDVGVYNVALACSLLGCDPAEIASQAAMLHTGVDAKSTLLLRYSGGASAVLMNALTAQLPGEALISGSKGSILIPQHWRAQTAELILPQALPAQPLVEKATADFGDGNGYQYEILDAMARIQAGEQESPLMTLSDSLEIGRAHV